MMMSENCARPEGYGPHLHDGPKLWVLNISSFRGVSFGAVHWYGELDPGGASPDGRNDFDDFRIERELTAEAAADLTAKDHGFKWEEGWTTTRFDTKEQVTAAALAVWETLKADGDALTADWLYEATVIAGPEGVERISPTIFGYGCTPRKLVAVVREADDGWQFVRVEGLPHGAEWFPPAPHSGFDRSGGES